MSDPTPRSEMLQEPDGNTPDAGQPETKDLGSLRIEKDVDFSAQINARGKIPGRANIHIRKSLPAAVQQSAPTTQF
jgi:hypothetical protein